jgi:hypothetical protein
MGIIATALQHMIAAGMPGEQIVRAVAAMEVATDTRSAGARRQARYRERNKEASMATAAARDDDMESAPLLPLSFDANTPSLSDRTVAAWNEAAARAGLSQARPLDAGRKAKLAQRARAHGEQAVFDAIANLAASRFHCGNNIRGWKATLGWLLESPENFLKAVELGEGAVRAAPAMSEAQRAAYLAQLDARPWEKGPWAKGAPPARQGRRGSGPPAPIGTLLRQVTTQVAA